MTMHIVESTKETVRSGYLDPAAQSVAIVESGDIFPAILRDQIDAWLRPA